MAAEQASEMSFICTLDCWGSGIVVEKYSGCQLDPLALELSAYCDLQKARIKMWTV
jgi:hypothetical protein